MERLTLLNSRHTFALVWHWKR